MHFNIINIEQLDSTNLHLAKLIKENKNIEEGYVISAYSQIKGKGTASNNWESEDGKNLTISILLKPYFIHASEQFNITQLISVSIIETLEEYYSLSNLKIKWPNDIYFEHKKLCGMLIQNTIKGNNIENSIIGIGLNVNQTEFSSALPNPVSLKQIKKTDFNNDEILQKILEKLAINYERLTVYPKSGWLESKYLNMLYRINEVHKYKDSNGVFDGIISGIDDYGRLKISCDGIERIYAFKEVEYII